MPAEETKKEYIIIVTKDYSGLGFAKMAMEAGFPTILATAGSEPEQYDKLAAEKNLTMKEIGELSELEKQMEGFEKVGDGIVPRIPLEKLMESRAKYKTSYWIWDGNHNWEQSEQLRKEGFPRVLGGSELNDKMEHDRKFGEDMVREAGLPTPETIEFPTISDGLAFLEEDGNLERAFVFKPDDGEGSYSTYVPDCPKDKDAHDELVDYMKALPEEGGNYILQERKKGVETNVEVWIYKGQPFFAFCDLECKRRSNGDKGEMVGCAFDFAFTVPLECKAVTETVMKLLPHMPADYTGFIDMNFIVSEKQNYFLEFCARFGYNAHPNLFINLGIRSFPEIITDFMDGRIERFYDNFNDGFGASILCRIDHPKAGFPIILLDGVEKDFYFFDAYRQDDKYFIAGYGNEVGIICGQDYTIKTAGEEALNNLEKIHYPSREARTDIDKNDYPTSPQARYDALEAMDYFDVIKD
jgi:phosphoribosylamine-glycine ligase